MSTNEPMPQEQLDAIQRRVGSATEGPWCNWSGWDQGDNCVHSESREDMHTVADVIPEPDDARFIAHAREDIPALLAEVERLRTKPTVTDDMVERALRERNRSSLWDEMLDSKDEHDVFYVQRARDEMRNALNAALNTEEKS